MLIAILVILIICLILLVRILFLVSSPAVNPVPEISFLDSLPGEGTDREVIDLETSLLAFFYYSGASRMILELIGPEGRKDAREIREQLVTKYTENNLKPLPESAIDIILNNLLRSALLDRTETEYYLTENGIQLLDRIDLKE